MKLVDGLPDIFAETFGEPVVYTPINGDPVEIEAIWIETATSVVFDEADADGVQVELHVRAADIAEPREGDTVERVANGKTMKVVPPIRPDDQGMIGLTLAQFDA